MLSKIVFLFVAVLGAAVFIQGALLNGHCESDDHCGAIDSYCNNGTCVCREHFAYHGDACVQVIDPRMGCMSTTDCRPSLGDRSMCKDSSCACIPYHHLHNNTCIKNRGLHERCDEDFQCYWGIDMTDKMACLSGECTCKAGFRMHQHRRCESGANSNFVTSAATIMIVFLFNKLV